MTHATRVASLLETARLELRHFDVADAEFIVQLLSEPSFLRDNTASIRVLEKLGLQFERMMWDPGGAELKLVAG